MTTNGRIRKNGVDRLPFIFLINKWHFTVESDMRVMERMLDDFVYDFVEIEMVDDSVMAIVMSRELGISYHLLAPRSKY